jgi:hypothetical protein
METFLQKLNTWVKQKKETIDNKDVFSLIEELENKIEDFKKDDRYIINSAYDKGYRDCELKKYKKSDYYSVRYSINDMLLSYKKNIQNGN